MIRDVIKEDILKAAKKLGLGVGDVELMRPTDLNNGDYSTNLALKIGTRDQRPETRGKIDDKKDAQGRHSVSQSPNEFAKKIADSLKNQPYIEKLEVAGPGFINFFIKPDFWQSEVEKVLKEGSKYGSNTLGKSKKARVEFVSANPTGPMHFGNARGGPIGDVLASVLEFSGYSIIREYYHNDLGVQVEKLGESIINVSAGGKLEDQEYKGEYVRDLGREIGKVSDSKEAGQRAVEILLKMAISDCADMGIKFDQVYAESDFVKSGKTKTVVEALKKNGFLKESEGAVWFAPNDKFLEDRETVVVKSDGNYTYFANDIAYHKEKFQDDPGLVIDIFGANHHGHVPRLQAVIESLGFDVDKFHVILYQWVRFKRGGELVKMSKRAGTFVTAKEVLDEIGRDALRFFILMHDANSPIDFDLDLAREKSNKNPVYYVQYAHARICSILAKAGNDEKLENKSVDYGLLSSKYELDLIKQITRLPEVVEDASKNLSVNQLTTFARALADDFHAFYEKCKVISDKDELTTARLALVKATKITFENCLGLLGISAPEKM